MAIPSIISPLLEIFRCAIAEILFPVFTTYVSSLYVGGTCKAVDATIASSSADVTDSFLAAIFLNSSYTFAASSSERS